MGVLERGQISFEFLIVYSFVLIVFLVMFALIAAQRAATLNEQQYSTLQLIAQSVAGYINQAASSGSGFNETIQLPPSISTIPYNITISTTGVVIVSATVGSQILRAYSFSSARNLVINGTLSGFSTGSISLYTVPNGTNLFRVANLNGLIFVDEQPISVRNLASYLRVAQPQSTTTAYFSGSTSYAYGSFSPAPLTYLTNWTVSGWIYPTLGGRYMTFFSQGTPTPTLQCGINPSNELYAATTNALGVQADVIDTSQTIPLDQWTFVLCELNGTGGGSEQLIVAQGTPSTFGTYATGYVSDNPGNNYMGIGFSTGGLSNALVSNSFLGGIANMQLYDTNLKPADWSSLYGSGISGQPLSAYSGNLIGWYRLNGNGADSSGNGWQLATSGIAYRTAIAIDTNTTTYTNAAPQSVAGLTASLIGFASGSGGSFGPDGNNATISFSGPNANGILATNGTTGSVPIAVTGFNDNASYFGIPYYNKFSGWWPLDEGSGTTAYDMNGSTNNDSLTFEGGQNGYPKWSEANQNVTAFRAAQFLGYPQDSWINIPQSSAYDTIPDNGTFTAVAWIYFNGCAGTHYTPIFGDLSGSFNGFQLQACNPYPLQIARTDVPWPSGNPGNFPTGEWIMVVGQYSSRTGLANVYLNNTVYSSNNIGSGAALATSYQLGIGTDALLSGGVDTFNGLISNVQLYGSFLNQSQINTLYGYGIDGVPLARSGLLGWWPLDGDSNDYSSNLNDGTANAVTFNNVVTSHAATNPIYSVAFDPGASNGIATNGNVQILSGAGPITFTAWVNPSYTQANSIYNIPVFYGPGGSCPGGSGKSFFLLVQRSGVPGLGTDCNDFTPANGPKVNWNTWNLLAGEVSGDSANVFLNGAWLNGTLGSSMNLQYGSLDVGGAGVDDDLFNGSVSDVQAYNAPLNTAQLMQMYEQGLPLVDYLNLSTLQQTGYAFVVNHSPPPATGPGTVTLINTATDKAVANFTIGQQSYNVEVTPDGTKAVISEQADHVLGVINTASLYAPSTIPLEGQSTFFALSPDGTEAVVPINTGPPGSFEVVSTLNGSLLASVPVGNQPYAAAVTPNGQQAFVIDFSSSDAYALNMQTYAVTGPISVGSSPETLAITPDSKKVFVANFFGDSVSVISTASDSVIATVGTHTGPDAIAFTPNGAYAYVVDYGTTIGYVDVINTTTDAVVTSVTVGYQPSAIAISPNGAYAYVVNSGFDTVSVINTTTNQVTATVTVGVQPGAIAVTPDGKQLFVGNELSDTVSIINTTTLAVKTVPVGNYPWSIAIT